jgi:hypothetical protein
MKIIFGLISLGCFGLGIYLLRDIEFTQISGAGLLFAGAVFGLVCNES